MIFNKVSKGTVIKKMVGLLMRLKWNQMKLNETKSSNVGAVLYSEGTPPCAYL